MDRALIVVCALLLNAAAAGPRWWYAMLGLPRARHACTAFLRDLERRLNREHRSLRDRELRGMLLVGAAVVASVLAAWIIEWLFGGFLRSVVDLVILFAALPLRPSWDMAAALRRRLYVGNVPAARQVLDATLWRHAAALDEYGLSRAGIETLAVAFSEKIMGPVCWYLLLGLPGLLVSKAVYLLQETLVRPGAEEGFSSAAQAMHYLLHYIPSRLSALLWLAASLFLPSGNITAAAQRLMPGLAAAAPQALALLSAASVLHLALGGPTSVYVNTAWIGDGSPRPGAGEIKRGLYLFALASLLLFVLVGFFL